MEEHNLPKGQSNLHLDAMVKELVNVFGDPMTWEQPVDLGLGRLKKKKKDKQKKKRKDSTETNEDNSKETLLTTEKKSTETTAVTTTKGKEKTTTTTTTTTTSINTTTISTANDTKTDNNTSEGRMEKENRMHVSYFRVIYWPFGQKLRQHFGLPPCHFHITIGFDPKDIHTHKGPNTLLLNNLQLGDPQIDRLIKTAKHYPEETQFLQRFHEFLEKHQMGHLAEPWLHHIPPATESSESENKAQQTKLNGKED
ncbi:uncharacterized protein BX664DRAFT_320181 [Halteromyces radiatus]|uniref:uncharacterized protein n=1 Tax=Halteromyces radiatus TaxID=101107 RepID=UPI00221F2C8E|nr:uncharacterized protein BX664DRAFT_320181 [Halteromyces radiatus]KAI8099016.1 hypothetical protein BX664DRAFT_320181 [Halteromyces radiatus]